MKIQAELKAPKSQFNSYGQYSYRSVEDILQAVKPLLAKYNDELVLTDDIVLVGNRFYVKATASFKENENKKTVVTGFAREAENKKGMDASQITGTASSYARKYALNGLFLIDDTKDADTNEYRQQSQQPQQSNQRYQNYQGYNRQRNYQNNNYNQNNYNNNKNYNGGN